MSSRAYVGQPLAADSRDDAIGISERLLVPQGTTNHSTVNRMLD